MLSHTVTLNILRFQRGGDSKRPKYAATLYTAGNKGIVIKLFFSNVTFSWLSTQEMQIFCSTATANMYSRGYQLLAPITTQPLSSTCRKIAYNYMLF